MKTTITVVGGRMDGGEENIKWIEDFHDIGAALEAANKNQYPILTIEITKGGFVWSFDYYSSIYRKEAA